MTKAIHHMPKDSGQGIKFCIINSEENPSITQEAESRLKRLKKHNGQKLHEILDEDYDGCSLLHYAAEYGNATILRMLLEYGAKPNDKDRAGDTALHRASRRGHLECIEILCNFAAAVFSRNNEGKTPMQLAEDHGKTTVMEKLVAMGKKPHMIGSRVEENSEKITLNKDAIQQITSCAEKNATAIADISSKLIQLTAAVEQLQGQIGQQEVEPPDQHQGEDETLHEQLAETEDQTMAQAKTVQHQDDVPALQEQLEEMKRKMAEQEVQLKALDEHKITALREEILKLQQSDQEHDNQVDRLNEVILKEEEPEADNEGEAAATQQQVNELSSQLAKYQGEMAALCEEIHKTQSRLEECGNQVNRLQQAVFPVSTPCEDAVLYKQLRRNYRLMLTELDGQEMRGALFEEEVLSAQEMYFLTSAGDEQEQLERLLIHLFSKEDPRSWMKPFMEALKKINTDLHNAIVSTEDETSVKEPV